MRSHFTVVFLSCALFTSAFPNTPDERGHDKPQLQVRDLVDQMQKGNLASRTVPGLTHEHIPALLSYAESKTMLKKIPSNPLSSFAQRKCTTGMAALWIVEGIRKQGGKRFAWPSLNAMCFRKGDTDEGQDWEEASLQNQTDIAEAYATWWKRVATPGGGKTLKSNPLEGTGLQWR